MGLGVLACFEEIHKANIEDLLGSFIHIRPTTFRNEKEKLDFSYFIFYEYRKIYSTHLFFLII
jgi:hypothetical protein